MANWFQRNFNWGSGRRLKNSESRSATYSLTDDALARMLGLENIAAHASPRTAMSIAKFFGCVRFISDLLAAQPYGLYQELKTGGSRKATDHPLHQLLHTRPNAHMSSFVARRTMFANLVVYGFAVAHVLRDENNRVYEIKPYPSNKVAILEDPETGFYFFQINTRSGLITVSEDNVIFLKDLSFDGELGNSIVKWQADTIKTHLLIEKFTQKFYEKGTFMSGFITTDLPPKSDEKAKLYKERLVEALQGSDTGGYGFAILGDGAKWNNVTTTPIEAQVVGFLERGDKDISTMFGIPMAMIGDTEKQTSWGTGVEQSFIGVTNTVIIPKAVQLEQEIDYKCLSVEERRQGYYSKMNFRNLLRGDAKSYGEYISKMFQIGAFSQDEIRSWDEMAPIEGGHGKHHWVQGALVRIDQPKETSKQQKQKNGQQTVSPSSN